MTIVSPSILSADFTKLGADCQMVLDAARKTVDEAGLSALSARGLATAVGYSVVALDLVMMVAIEVTVVTALPAMGTVLCVSLLVAPAAAARQWSDRVGTTMALAAGFGVASGAIGLAISVGGRTAAGATVALVAAAIFLVSTLARPSKLA